ncbi:MAG: AAA family ATPase, partial [Succinatimonas sp.]|nr:AAA family ATPase [Succinatimonas sp.]
MTAILKNSQNISRRKNIGTGLMVFSEFQECNSYYVDKTSFIKDLMNDGKQTLLFTRPRRFGKTLTQSMLKEFLCLNYEARPDHDEKLHKLFDHLQVSSDPEFCKQHMGRYPVIFVSFKGIDQPYFEGMRSELIRLVRTLYRSFAFLLEGGKIGEFDLNSFREYAEFNNLKSRYEEDSLITGCLEFLCELLKKIYDQKVIVLIDEYDVPINRGHSCGFYDQILPLIRGMLYPVVKDDRG